MACRQSFCRDPQLESDEKYHTPSEKGSLAARYVEAVDVEGPTDVGILASMSLLRLQQLAAEGEEIRCGIRPGLARKIGKPQDLSKKDLSTIRKQLEQDRGFLDVANKRLDELGHRLASQRPPALDSYYASGDTLDSTILSDDSDEDLRLVSPQQFASMSCSCGGDMLAAAQLEARYRLQQDRRGFTEVQLLHDQVCALLEQVRAEISVLHKEHDCAWHAVETEQARRSGAKPGCVNADEQCGRLTQMARLQRSTLSRVEAQREADCVLINGGPSALPFSPLLKGSDPPFTSNDNGVSRKIGDASCDGTSVCRACAIM